MGKNIIKLILIQLVICNIIVFVVNYNLKECTAKLDNYYNELTFKKLNIWIEKEELRLELESLQK